MAIEHQTYTVSQVAEIVGVSPSSVRAWCSEFKDHLSQSATPANGQMRVFSSADVATLQQVRQLRSQGLTYDQIISRLAMGLNEPTTLFVVSPAAISTPSQSPTEAPTDAVTLTAALQLLQAVDARTAPLQRRLDALQSHQSTKITWLVIGFCLGLLAALVAAGLLALMR